MLIWHHFIYSNGVIVLTFCFRYPIDQFRQPEQLDSVERRAPVRRDHERVRLCEIRPRGRQPKQLPFVGVHVHAILAPRAPVVRELELPSAEGMERMSHPNESCPICLIGCS